MRPAKVHFRWFLLALSALTNALVVAAPSMAMPVLFAEISADLQLSLVQVGLVWGISSLPGIFTALLGGAIGDRFGPKRVILLGCLLVGVFGALRGQANDFLSLIAAMFLLGMVTPMVVMNTLKTCGMWFPRRQLGLASGVLSMGMALGFMLGSLLSATTLSPWLGGWRPVLWFYGAIAIVLILPWLFVPRTPVGLDEPGSRIGGLSLREGVVHVARLRNIWLLGLAIFGMSGCVQGTLGYLPLHLRGLGWPEVSADGALAAFHTISLAFVVPIALGSDRLGSRKKVLFAAGFLVMAGVGLLSVADGVWVWIAVLIAGMVRDGYMAVFMTSVIETEGVGVAYAGTATGFVMIFGGISNLVAPPLGNSLASIAPGLPFAFWAVLLGFGLVGVWLSK